MQAGDHQRQQVFGRGMRHAHAHMAPAQGAQILHLGQRVVEIALAAPHGGQHQFAGRRQLHAARQAVEQRHAHLGLQVEDLLVHGRRRQVQRDGRLAHRATARHLVKTAIGLGDRGHGVECKFLSDTSSKTNSYS
jgi:hypothetical protein